MDANKRNDEYISLLTNSGFFNQADAELFCDKFEEATILTTNEKGYCTLIKAKRFGKWHIIKRLKKEYCSNSFFTNLLEKEFEIGYKLDHPNIAKTIAKEYDDNGMYIISEFIDGITLREYIELNKTITTRLKRKFIIEIVNALKYIHSKQIIHRDLKPENILITHNGDNVKLIDFGLSDADNYHIFKEAAGTKNYAAPEILNNEDNITFKADLYSLGKIILDLWSVSEETINKIERPYRIIAKKCLEKNPEIRYANYDTVINDLAFSYKTKTILYFLAFLAILTVLFLTTKNRGIKNHDNTTTKSKGLSSSITNDIPTPSKKDSSAIPKPSLVVVAHSSKKDTINKTNKHLLTKAALSLEDSLLMEAKELIPNVMKDFYNKYKLIEITTKNDITIGTELGIIRQTEIPRAISVFMKKLTVGTDIELKCTRIIEDQERIARQVTEKMFEKSNEARGIPSQRKSAYMRKMYNIYSDSTLANMKKGNVNKLKIKQFRDSTKKYNWFSSTAEILKQIIVPDSFEWEYK